MALVNGLRGAPAATPFSCKPALIVLGRPPFTIKRSRGVADKMTSGPVPVHHFLHVQ